MNEQMQNRPHFAVPDLVINATLDILAQLPYAKVEHLVPTLRECLQSQPLAPSTSPAPEEPQK